VSGFSDTHPSTLATRHFSASEHHLKPQTQHCRRVDAAVIDPGQYKPRGDVDLVLLRSSDDLQVRRQQQPRRNRGIVESLETVFVPEKFPRLNESLKRRVIDVDVVISQSELVQRPALEHAFAADTKAAEKLHKVRIAVGNPEPREDTDTLINAFFRLVEILVKVVINVPGAFFRFKPRVPNEEVQPLIDGLKIFVRKSRAEKLMSGEAEKVRS